MRALFRASMAWLKIPEKREASPLFRELSLQRKPTGKDMEKVNQS